MTLRPLGWELGLFLVLVGLTALGLLAGSETVVASVLYGCAIATPLILVSFVVRLVAGMVQESRNRRGLRPSALSSGTTN